MRHVVCEVSGPDIPLYLDIMVACVYFILFYSLYGKHSGRIEDDKMRLMFGGKG